MYNWWILFVHMSNSTAHLIKHFQDLVWRIRLAVSFLQQFDQFTSYNDSELSLYCYNFMVEHMFESEGKILMYGHSNESQLEAFSCGAGYYAVQGNSNF